MTERIKVWDLPLRVFHWVLVAAVTGAFITGEFGGGLTDWHGRLGTLVLGLLIFRVIWGFAGSRYSRFTSFFPTPAKLQAYLKGEWREDGHSPLGALAVLALLALLVGLATTGLFANDDIAFQGPLFSLIDKDLSDRLSGWHAQIFNLLAVMVALHLIAIAFYFFIKKNNLVMPMLTGHKKAKDHIHQAGDDHVANVSLTRFLIVALVSAGITWAIHDGLQLWHQQTSSAVNTKAQPVRIPNW
ncbi:MAG TPA: cytochrome b/b6 domain-containing protein [Methylotenera sp.]|nr:cytochrome b/b6 domain-containing protein [Methylotenera sp.]